MKQEIQQQKGFTLIEILVVCIILAFLITIALILLDPLKYINEAHDAQRRQDFQQALHALDMYYNDHNCYPDSSTFQFGKPFVQNGVVYMQKVPEDPLCSSSNPKQCYAYETDGGSCPQWVLLLGNVVVSSQSSNKDCPLPAFNNNTPGTCVLPSGNYNGKSINYNLCAFLGSLSCSLIANYTPVVYVPINQTISPTPVVTTNARSTNVPSPTQTPFPTPRPPTQSVGGCPSGSTPYVCAPSGNQMSCNLAPSGNGPGVYCSLQDCLNVCK